MAGWWLATFGCVVSLSWLLARGRVRYPRLFSWLCILRPFIVCYSPSLTLRYVFSLVHLVKLDPWLSGRERRKKKKKKKEKKGNERRMTKYCAPVWPCFPPYLFTMPPMIMFPDSYSTNSLLFSLIQRIQLWYLYLCLYTSLLSLKTILSNYVANAWGHWSIETCW